jgi:UDP-N-acetylmuramoylalanine--D-glutamate ligase
MTTTPFSVAGKRVVVAGAARSGIAAAQLLARRGAIVTLSELRTALPESRELEAAGITLELGGHTLPTFSAADLIVMSPGVPARQPVIEAARAAGAIVIGELELASRWLAGPIVAITGTKGKSTTATLTGRMLAAGGLEVLVGGNIGTALSAQVESSTASTIHVIEASSFQLEGIDTFHPWVAVLLNFSPDHLDRHASVEEYAAAKGRIFENQLESDWAVLNADDPASLEIARDVRAQRFLVSKDTGLREGICIENGHIVRRSPGTSVSLVPLSSVRLLGRHLLTDVMAAAAVAHLAGVPPAAMTAAVEGFPGLEHALEPVTDIGGVQFVNDSKATNIESARRAIESFGKGLVVILGGKFKGGDFAELADPLAGRDATVVAIGESRDLIAGALGSRVSVQLASDMRSAVRQAFALAAPGGAVLLAPACASFDMFRDYADRGRVFKQETRRLEEEWNSTREQ